MPIIVENESKIFIINALLDGGSTQICLNADITAKLGLHEEIQKSQVNAKNGTVASFETAPVEITLRSTTAQVNTVIEAFTISGATGDLKAVNWKAINRNWYQLIEVNFLQVNSRSKINMLMRVGYPDFRFSLKYIRGKLGQAIARLTPLEWTCIGNQNNTTTSWHQN